MKKQLLIGVISIFVCSLAFASGDTFQPVKTPDYFSGFYAGIGAGANYVTGDVENTIADNESLTVGRSLPIPSSVIYPFNENLNSFGFVGSLFGGYGKVFNRFYVGGELFGRGIVNHADASKSQTTTSATMLLTSISGKTEVDRYQYYSFGGAARLGFLITPRIMVYALAGVNVTQFFYKIKHSGGSAFYSSAPNPILPTDPLASSYEHDVSKVQAGFMPGAGVEVMVTNQLSLRAQYTYTIYGSSSFSGYSPINVGYTMDTTNVANAGFVTATSNGHFSADSISENAVTVGLTYHFNGVV